MDSDVYNRMLEKDIGGFLSVKTFSEHFAVAFDALLHREKETSYNALLYKRMIGGQRVAVSNLLNNTNDGYVSASTLLIICVRLGFNYSEANMFYRRWKRMKLQTRHSDLLPEKHLKLYIDKLSYYPEITLTHNPSGYWAMCEELWQHTKNDVFLYGSEGTGLMETGNRNANTTHASAYYLLAVVRDAFEKQSAKNQIRSPMLPTR